TVGRSSRDDPPRTQTRVFDAWCPAFVDRTHAVDAPAGHHASNTLGRNRSSGFFARYGLPMADPDAVRSFVPPAQAFRKRFALATTAPPATIRARIPLTPPVWPPQRARRTAPPVSSIQVSLEAGAACYDVSGAGAGAVVATTAADRGHSATTHHCSAP